jgi:hypothetical protein
MYFIYEQNVLSPFISDTVAEVHIAIDNMHKSHTRDWSDQNWELMALYLKIQVFWDVTLCLWEIARDTV